MGDRHLPEVVQRKSDLFQQWPSSLQPATHCLIMGGAGGCSTLHTDMLGWTGWNALLMGYKHWQFYPPAPEVGGVLCAEVKEMGGYSNLGFSCTSPVDMYNNIDGEKSPDRAPEADKRNRSLTPALVPTLTDSHPLLV